MIAVTFAVVRQRDIMRDIDVQLFTHLQRFITNLHLGGRPGLIHFEAEKTLEIKSEATVSGPDLFRMHDVAPCWAASVPDVVGAPSRSSPSPRPLCDNSGQLISSKSIHRTLFSNSLRRLRVGVCVGSRWWSRASFSARPRRKRQTKRPRFSVRSAVATQSPVRWTRKAAEWNPGSTRSTKTQRRAGRPAKRWEDDLNEFVKDEETEATQSNDL